MYIDHVCTIDSDLLAYGCRNVIYKLDFNGDCVNIVYDDIFKKIPSYNGWDNDKFLRYCILAGCDYFKLDKIGVKKAIGVINNGTSVDDLGLKMGGYDKLKYRKAYITFKLQIVYCPLLKKTRMLGDLDELPEELQELALSDDFYGKLLDDDTAKLIATCVIDPITYQPFNFMNI